MKVKKISFRAKMPTKAYDGDAGFDVYAPYSEYIYPREVKQIKLEIAIEILPDEVAIMSERSGMAIKYGLTSIGNIIDSGYRGEISIILANLGEKTFEYNQGDKIGQIIVNKLTMSQVLVVEELSCSERGKKAHYSSDE